jgi:type II secretory pathway component GspD/PulD (secretin)
VYRVAATSVLILLAACGPLPDPKPLKGADTTARQVNQRFTERQTEAVTRVPISRSAFRAVEMDTSIRSDLANRELDLRFAEGATLKDMITVLGTVNVPIVVNGEEGMDGVLESRLPFSSYKGTLGNLLDILRRANAIISVQRGDFIYLGTLARYSVDLPQDADIMGTIASEIESLGGEDVVQSVTSGQLIYKAKPDVHDSLIGPFLSRVSNNLAMVTMQVAVVSLALNDSTSQGFDWNAFKLGVTTVNQQAASGGTGGADGGGAEGGGADGPSTADGVPSLGSVIDASANAFRIGRTVEGSLFGKAATFTIGGALNFLSTFGDTEISQNVELRTVSGQEVVLRSGQEVPYVKGVSNTVSDGTTTGSVETEKIQTGLTLTMRPFFDSATGLVTLNMNMEQRQILQFVELSAGDGVGTITQPLTQDQNLTDLIRTPVGQTIVVGGIQNDSVSRTMTQPSIIRNTAAGDLLGSENRNISRNAFFVVVRPTVTIFERVD